MRVHFQFRLQVLDRLDVTLWRRVEQIYVWMIFVHLFDYLVQIAVVVLRMLVLKIVTKGN